MSEEATTAGNALSPEQANKILKADLANMVKKVASGRTLSSQERILLQEIGGNGPTIAFAKNQVELANALGVERKTVQRWLKEEGHPGAKPDGRYEVSAWQQWCRANAKKVGGSGPDQTKLKFRNLLLQNEKLEYQIGVLKRAFVPVSDVEKWGADLGADVRKVIQRLHLIAPSIAGLYIPEIEARLKEVEDEVLLQLHMLGKHVEQWREKVDPIIE